MTPWFERRFDFPVPLAQYPELLWRLKQAPGRVEGAMRAMPGEFRVRQPEGKWSAQEHAGHLVVLDAVWLARVGDFTGGASSLTPADLTNRLTTEGGFNEKPLEEILAAFRESRAKLVASLDRELPSHVLLHPRLKTPMTILDHLYFVVEHDDHHLALMESLAS